MKTKEEIVKMTKEELKGYKWHPDLDKINIVCEGHGDCRNCCYCNNREDSRGCEYCKNSYYCFKCKNSIDHVSVRDCNDCVDCKNCYLCRHLTGAEYMICNVQLTKEEYEKKMKELGYIL